MRVCKLSQLLFCLLFLLLHKCAKSLQNLSALYNNIMKSYKSCSVPSGNSKIFQHNCGGAYQCYDMVSGTTGCNETVVVEVCTTLLKV